jgi:hypothetical protein
MLGVMTRIDSLGTGLNTRGHLYRVNLEVHCGGHCDLANTTDFDH